MDGTFLMLFQNNIYCTVQNFLYTDRHDWNQIHDVFRCTWIPSSGSGAQPISSRSWSEQKYFGVALCFSVRKRWNRVKPGRGLSWRRMRWDVILSESLAMPSRLLPFEVTVVFHHSPYHLWGISYYRIIVLICEFWTFFVQEMKIFPD